MRLFSFASCVWVVFAIPAVAQTDDPYLGAGFPKPPMEIHEGGPRFGTVASSLIAAPEHEAFAEALRGRGLLKVLEGSGPFTVFVPPVVGSGSFADLGNHVVAGRWTQEVLARALEDGAGTVTMKAMGGAMVRVWVAKDGALMAARDGGVARAIRASSEAGNGTAYVLDGPFGAP